MTNYRVFVIIVALILFIPSIAFSQVVTNLNDSGPGSLRNVIASADPGDTITFDPSLNGGTITLQSVIQIPIDLTINGPGAENLTISGGNTNRIFQVISPMTPTTDVTITNLRFTNGFSNFGSALLMDTGGDYVIDNCVYESNSATGPGGVIADDSGGINLEINNCTFRFNSVTCNNNFCPGRAGVITFGGDDDLTITNSTFSHNSTTCIGDECLSHGGAILISGSGNFDTTFTSINNSFVSNTSTCEGNNCEAFGGAIFIEDERLQMDISFSTFSSNSVSCTGTGCTESGATIYNDPEESENGIVNISSSIFETILPLGNCGGINISSLGYNIDNGGTCINGIEPGDKPFTDPDLDPRGLQDNGGPTQTVALIVGSPALDMANPACPPPNTDQRGFPRAQNGRCDIGAYEGSIFRPQIVPTMSEWGLIAMAGILGLIGFMVIRRRAAY